MYSSKITNPIYDLNSSLFLEIVREILEAEFVNQRTNFAKTFLPLAVKTDSYLLNPISDKEINPAFCSVIKAKSTNSENQFHGQDNNLNIFIIGILANGLENLRKICDAAYIILNDMDVKNYLFNYKVDDNNIISDSGTYKVSAISTEFEVSKTMNDKNIVYGNLTLVCEIAEVAKFNTHEPLTEINTTHKLGVNEIEVIQKINL